MDDETPKPKPRILLVDDEAPMRDYLASALSDEFNVETAGDGEQALRSVLRARPDVVVTDLVMPKISGIELLRTLRSTPSTATIPVLLISGHALDEMRLEGFEHAADGFLEKPYTERELRSRIRAMLQIGLVRRAALRREVLEQAERQAMAERAALLESITDPFYALDRQWRFTYVNQRALDYLGASREDILNRNIWDVIPLARDGVFQTSFDQAVRENHSVAFEALSPHSNRWLGVYAYPTPQGLAVTFRDISERKQAEQALRESEGRYRVLFDSIDQGFCIVEVIFDKADRPVDYVFREINQAFGKNTGLSGAVGKRMRELVPAHEQYWFDVYGRIARTGVAERFEHQAAALGYWYDVYAFRVGAPEEHRVGVLFTDITVRKRSEEQLREADRRKDEFLATLAHELRNPLAPLKNGLQIARLTAKAESPLQRTVEMMDRQLNHLVRLVDDLLDVARISSGKVALRKEAVMLSHVLAQSMEGSRAMIDLRDQQLQIEKASENLCVEGDFDRLAQVFSNLLSNAAKYTPVGGQIGVKLAREDGVAVIRVIDSGIGIPPTDLTNVFDLFTQVRAHQGHAEGGLGIGLSLVKTLVNLHGGSVSAASAGAGKGSTFTVRLPLCKEDTATSSDRLPLVAHTADFVRRRIVVADDNVDAAQTLTELLQLEGHEVVLAHDGLEAITQVERFHPDLVFLDIGMPKMDGLEAARRLRASPEGARVNLIAVTGWGQPADRERTRQAGFDAHLVKPIDSAQLAEVLARPATAH